MSRKFYDAGNGQFHYACPGCGCYHFITVDKSQSPNWEFNGDVENPTVSPSVRVRSSEPITDEQHARIMAGEKVEVKQTVCHFFIRNGFYEYCSDSTHQYSGQKVEVPDWDKF